MRIKGEKTLFGESITTPKEFILDLCERLDKVYEIAINEEDKMKQLAYLTGFLTAFKGRLNRVCEKPSAESDFKSIDQTFNQNDRIKLTFEGEETFSAELINSPEEFIKDFCNRINILYTTTMEEEQDMSRLAYLITSLIGLKSRLNRVCKKI